MTLKRLRVLYGAATVLWLALAFMMDGMTGGLYWLVAAELGLSVKALGRRFNHYGMQYPYFREVKR